MLPSMLPVYAFQSGPDSHNTVQTFDGQVVNTLFTSAGDGMGDGLPPETPCDRRTIPHLGARARFKS